MAQFHQWALPMPMVALAGTTVDLASILAGSFGINVNISPVLRPLFHAGGASPNDYCYWKPQNPINATWTVGGNDPGPDVQVNVPASAISRRPVACRQ